MGTGASFVLQQRQQHQTKTADVCSVRDVSDKQQALPLGSVLAMACPSDSAIRRLAGTIPHCMQPMQFTQVDATSSAHCRRGTALELSIPRADGWA